MVQFFPRHKSVQFISILILIYCCVKKISHIEVFDLIFHPNDILQGH